MIKSFNLSPTPRIIFGTGKLQDLSGLLRSYGNSALLITGKKSFVESKKWDQLQGDFFKDHIKWNHIFVDCEPTLKLIDEIVAEVGQQKIDIVIAIGGGSVIDAGKAISGMLVEKDSIKNYMEDIGYKQPSGKKIPFIAIPTTSGTGSEATKNAVISKIGENGFKKSLRHDNYTPNIALIDPSLSLSCSKSITAQSGMDAFTQLLESYLSKKSNPITDSLAIDGIRMIRDGLPYAVTDGSNIQARENMAYAALISGITLANAGLGTIHGFASSIGGFFNIPHGLICAKLMGPINRITVIKLRSQNSNSLALKKYARIGKLFNNGNVKTDKYYIDLLLDIITKWTEEFGLKGFSEFGMSEKDFSKIISKTGNKYNPVELNKDEMFEALMEAL